MRSSMLAGRDQDGRFRSKGGFASLISCDESDARLDLKRLAVCAPPLLAKHETQSLPESLLLALQVTNLLNVTHFCKTEKVVMKHDRGISQ